MTANTLSKQLISTMVHTVMSSDDDKRGLINHLGYGSELDRLRGLA